MPRLRSTRKSADVITIVRDTDILDEIRIVWDGDENRIVKATYIVPDADGTLRRETRESSANPTGFINAVFSDTK